MDVAATIPNMQDKKVIATLKEMEVQEGYLLGTYYEHPKLFFAEAVARTRLEGSGVAIADIAKCFKKQFDEAELESLIRELNKHD